MSSSIISSISRHHPYKIMNHCKRVKTSIRTIIIRNLEEKITETDLTIYFAIFGKIANLSIKESRLISNRKFALVTYKLPEEASMALRIKHHKLKGVKLQVAAAASWNQPSLSETVKSPPIDTTISIPNSNLPNYSLLSLNDDCLLHVLSFLNLAEQVKVSGLCSRLNAIGQIMFRKVKRVKLNDTGFDTLLEASNIVQNINRHLEHFVISFGGRSRSLYQYSAKFLPPLCSNLKILELVDIKLKRNTYKSLIPVFRNLESLTLKHCGVTDNFFILLETCLKIKKLDISGNRGISGNELYTLPDTIMELNLSDCTGISQNNFIDLCRVAMFKSLNINGCFQFCHILVNLTQIESLEAIYMYNYLDFSHMYEYGQFFEALIRKKSNTLQRLCMYCLRFNDFQKKSFRNFSNLKHLCLSNIDEHLLNRLPNSLTYLAITESHHVSVDALIEFVERSPHIQTIDVSYCKQFSCMLVFKLLKKLKLLKRPLCLKLVVEGTKIRLSVKEEPLYRELKHLLELSFIINQQDCNHEIWAFNRSLSRE